MIREPSPPARSSLSIVTARLERLRTFLHQNIGGGDEFAGTFCHELDRIDDLAAFAIDRQPNRYARAFAEPAADINIAVVQLHQPLDDRKAETRAIVPAVIGGARLKESFAQTRQIGFADTDTGILDSDRELWSIALRADGDTAAARRKLDGV